MVLKEGEERKSEVDGKTRGKTTGNLNFKIQIEKGGCEIRKTPIFLGGSTYA